MGKHQCHTKVVQKGNKKKKNEQKRMPLEDGGRNSNNSSYCCASNTTTKKHTWYDPGVPMTKKELARWRKEARRVRNRESAAASRRKTRDQIGELESEVESLKSKYEAALKQVADLELLVKQQSSNDSFSLTTNKQQGYVSLPRFGSSMVPSPITVPTVLATGSFSPIHREDDETMKYQEYEEHNNNNSTKYQQHIMNMISRHNACVGSLI